MTTIPTGRVKLGQRLAAEIRAEMARQMITQSELARRLGVIDMWLSRRLRGQQPLNVDELERIAEQLGISELEFMARATRTTRTEVTREVSSRTWPPRRSLLPGDRPLRLTPALEDAA